MGSDKLEFGFFIATFLFLTRAMVALIGIVVWAGLATTGYILEEIGNAIKNRRN